MWKINDCFLVILFAATCIFQTSDASWGSFVNKANSGLDMINKFTEAFSTQSTEDLVGQQLDRGFQRWQQKAKVSLKANIPPAILGKALRKTLGEWKIPVDYARAIESEIQQSYSVPTNIWKESSFIFSMKCGKHNRGGRRERRQQIREYCAAATKKDCREFKKQVRSERYFKKGCQVFNLGLYISRNPGCGTMNYVLVQSQISLKLAADIFVIKKTTHSMGGSFTSGSIKFKKRKQAMKPQMVVFITAMAEKVSLEAALQKSSQMLNFIEPKCSSGLTGRRRPEWMQRRGRQLEERKRGRKEFKRQCKQECKGMQKGKRKCIKECTVRKSRNALLQNGDIGAGVKERLCLEKCADMGRMWPDDPMCFSNCLGLKEFKNKRYRLGLKEFKNKRYQRRSFNPSRRPGNMSPRQQSHWPSTTGVGRGKRGGREEESTGPQLTSGSGFTSGWLKVDFDLKKKYGTDGRRKLNAIDNLSVVSRRSLGSKNCGALCQRWKRQNEIRKMCKTTKCAGLGKQCVMQCTRYVLRKRAKRRKHKELKKTNYMCMKKCYGMTHSKCYQNCKNPPQRPNLTTAYKQYRNPYRIYDWRDRYQPPLINENRRPQNVYAEPTQNGGPDVYTGPKISEVEETVDGANMYTGPPIS